MNETVDIVKIVKFQFKKMLKEEARLKTLAMFYNNGHSAHLVRWHEDRINVIIELFVKIFPQVNKDKLWKEWVVKELNVEKIKLESFGHGEFTEEEVDALERAQSTCPVCGQPMASVYA